MGAIGAKVDSIYASESLATSSCNPTANIWLNDSTSNPNTVHKTIGSVCDNNYNSKLKFKIKIPNATELNFNTTTGLTIINNSDHLLLEGNINPTVSETRKTFYITYSSKLPHIVTGEVSLQHLAKIMILSPILINKII